MSKTPSLRSLLNKELKEKGRSCIATYGLKFSNGEHRLHVNDVCHARAKFEGFYYDKDRIRSNPNLEIVELSNIICPYEDVDKKLLSKWVKYIITESPFNEMFLTKNIQAVWRYGVQMDVNKSLSCVVAALIALREGWEFPHILKNWNRLVAHGVNKHVAFLASRMFDVELNKINYGGHQSIGQITVKNAKFLITKGLFEHDGPLKINKKSYAIFKATRSDEYVNKNLLSELLYKGAKKGRGWGAVGKLSIEQLVANCKEFERMLND